ncbi:unnamed protein product [Amaranthus hypochondriacus]
MALDAVIFSQDPLITPSFNYCPSNFGMSTYNEFANYYYYPSLLDDNNNNNNLKVPFNDGLLEVNNNNNNVIPCNLFTPSELMNIEWNQQSEHQQYVPLNLSSSPEENLYLSGQAQPPPRNNLGAQTKTGVGPRRKSRRRNSKNKEEVEHQRMTHIAVERNRRKQMNEYLAVIRSLMPPSCVQRGDQASIVGGAINYVKELEQLLQSMETRKISKKDNQQPPPPPSPSEGDGGGEKRNAWPEIFNDFFSFPQYSTRSKSEGNSVMNSCNRSVGDIEVTMVESHANVKIMAKKQPKQLVKLIAGFQGLRLNVLHLNVTTIDSFVLYSLSLKVEEGCQLSSVDDIAGAANHILGQIQEEAGDHLL